MKKTGRKVSVIVVFIITVSFFITISCSSKESVGNKLIGRWKVDLLEFSTGESVKDPDMEIEFLKNEYIVYTKGREEFSLFYQVKKDYVSYYLETTYKGQKKGERLYFDGNDNLSFEFSEKLNNSKIKVKYYLSRIKEDDK